MGAWARDMSGSSESVPESGKCSPVTRLESSAFLFVDKTVSPKTSRLMRRSLMQESTQPQNLKSSNVVAHVKNNREVYL
jgi:hypothetical protein